MKCPHPSVNTAHRGCIDGRWSMSRLFFLMKSRQSFPLIYLHRVTWSVKTSRTAVKQWGRHIAVAVVGLRVDASFLFGRMWQTCFTCCKSHQCAKNSSWLKCWRNFNAHLMQITVAYLMVNWIFCWSFGLLDGRKNQFEDSLSSGTLWWTFFSILYNKKMLNCQINWLING